MVPHRLAEPRQTEAAVVFNSGRKTPAKAPGFASPAGQGALSLAGRPVFFRQEPWNLAIPLGFAIPLANGRCFMARPCCREVVGQAVKSRMDK